MSAVSNIEQRHQKLRNNSNFVIYLIGLSFSNLGSSITTFVFPLMILELTNSAFQVALVTALTVIPYALLGLPAGAIIDKLNRKKIMQIADIARFLGYLTIPIAHFLGYLSIYQIYVVALISGIALVFHSISEVSSLPSIVEKEHLSAANSYIYASQNLTSVLGPTIGGTLYALFSYPSLIAFDSITFLISFFSLILIKNDFTINNISKEKSKISFGVIKEDIVIGLKYLFSDSKIKVMAIIITWTNLLVAPYYIYTVIFAKDSLQTTPELLGMLFGFSSLGALAGSLLTTKLSNKFGFGKLIIILILVDTVARLLLPFSPNIYWMIPVMAFTYGAQAIINIAIITLRQTTVPSELLGRVNSVFRTMVFASRPIGLFIGGVIIEKFGGFTALLSVGILCIPIFLYALSSKLYTLDKEN
ncbi:MFS transporter [Bacillus cereus]|uniref:MFS transporter n=1 Tax=Bacillus cereus TaxID=1396 RepID=UPI002AC0EA80|nr:MFS transporter [Bacillus cereus]MDZ4481532.1 MFS transporter [Bacillus cereus]MDZ4497370.1 MFS transporter [Bacillus cereus]MDZ4519250.1 MFS transporter [Bacillus cereus]MDZ4583434.1 MFS transporter [Bacillus cereus]